ncbi:MAG: DUF861 domain-containing protein [Kordiimonadaceae bacterium]|nr:DUF861 domain-containing protein [Kordiimonadaceae bacterium]MBO6568675.1 DUF861 domain-containing protein [Kordiimonadaceae bacterium]MBO6965349.1 DUF861 domain-containing protein [Kordiimonadaceae bacterium]
MIAIKRFLTHSFRAAALLGAVAATATMAQADGHGGGVKPPAPWTAAMLNKMVLDKLPDIDWSPVESGTRRNAETVLFEGENTVSVWDAGPAKLILDEPLPYDEFVFVLKGTLVLTDNEGNSQTYKVGDFFMLPKGFMGTWDMTEEYRELIIIDTTAYNEDG